MFLVSRTLLHENYKSENMRNYLKFLVKLAFSLSRVDAWTVNKFHNFSCFLSLDVKHAKLHGLTF